ncbi:bile acid:sodium symporter family protein [Effusibacillus dendaii]|uniref:Sodium transporter n=1 Tax=Effusibacillus dendaii TaxID=2743772 RepID=A0A7I8D975_9BACL|nr:bile acid:sodium symporter family protein [Effusibacillus dendaii]BCJ86635.1 sodium transporter [Effusibacillus dendaii]
MKTLERTSQFVGGTFAVWVLVFAALGFFFPSTFLNFKSYISPLLGIVMFGMGLTLSASDFKEVFKRPKDVAIGVVGHYIIMPLLAYLLCIALQLPPDIAVGVILVGSCPSGTSSNVMTFLAKGDVALAVSIATVSTVLAPFVTPFLISVLAGHWTPVDPMALFKDIIQIVIVPIVLGLIVKALFRKQAEASVKALPLVSTIAIVLIVSAVVAGSHDRILKTGLLIFAVVILHNVLGFLLGYFFPKLFGMELPKRKAVAFEVGMQNSGLGVALASAHFNPLAAVPSAIFSVWHNLSGSILASIFAKMDERRNHQ